MPVVRQASPQPRILGTERWATETNIGANVGLRGAWFAAPSDANFSQFRTRYRARYNADPFRLASLGYDAVLLRSADRRELADRPPLPGDARCATGPASPASTAPSASVPTASPSTRSKCAR